MSDERPAPPVPPEVDLRGFEYMPLDAQRLRDSDLATLASGDEFKAAVLLWCSAWHQVPAASLPDDDRLLAKFSGAGSKWGKVKEMALRGFLKCSDGRFYHPVVAEKALESWGKKLAHRERTRKATEARAAKLRDVSRNEQRNAQRNVEREEQHNPHQGKLREGKVTERNPSLTERNPSPGEIPPTPENGDRGVRLPHHWMPSAELTAWAKHEKPDVNLGAATLKFKNHFGSLAGKSGLRGDWDLAWKNWILNERLPNGDKPIDYAKITAQ